MFTRAWSFFRGLFKGWNHLEIVHPLISFVVREGLDCRIFITLCHMQWPSRLHSLLLRKESFPVCWASQVVRLEKTSLPLFMLHCVLPCQLIFLSLYLFIPLKALVTYGESVVANCILQYLSPERHSSWRQRKTLQ